MTERIFIYDRSGNLVNDPDRSTEYATNINFGSEWPKGFTSCSFTVPKNILAQWVVKQAYGVKIRDGARTLYQGRLEGPERKLSSQEHQIRLDAQGWYVTLTERMVRKRWIDKAPVDRLTWPVRDATQQSFLATKRQDFLQVSLARFGDLRAGTEVYRERYTAPQGTLIYRITFDYEIRTGEGGEVEVYNIDTAASEWSDNNTAGPNPLTDSCDLTLADAANIIELRFYPTTNDTYDPNDYVFLDNIVVYFVTDPADYDYDALEIVKDILAEVGSAISTDTDDLGNPGLTLSPFVTEGDNYEYADRIIQRAAAYGDASQGTWGFCIWDDKGTSDDLPKPVLEARSVSDYEYAVRLADLESFSDELDDSQLFNYIIVKYTDEGNIAQYRTPTDNASLTDSDSVSDYDQRETTLDIGQGDTTRADYVGERYIAYHKDPLHRTSFSVKGRIKTKEGLWIPANRVRAGERVKIIDYDGGTTYFLRHVRYDVTNQILSMQPDLPPDSTDTLLTQQEIMK